MCAWAEARAASRPCCASITAQPTATFRRRSCSASAIAARTDRLALNLVVILPFYDPVRLAEDMAVLDLVSTGRASLRVRHRISAGKNSSTSGWLPPTAGDSPTTSSTCSGTLLSGERVVREGRRIKGDPFAAETGRAALMWGGAAA